MAKLASMPSFPKSTLRREPKIFLWFTKKLVNIFVLLFSWLSRVEISAKDVYLQKYPSFDQKSHKSVILRKAENYTWSQVEKI